MGLVSLIIIANAIFPAVIKPPVRPPDPVFEPAGLRDLQAQLHDMQSWLTQHVNKVCALEGALVKEQDAIKREVEGLKGLIRGPVLKGEKREGQEDNDNDSRSMHAVVLHELESVEEEDQEQTAREQFAPQQTAAGSGRT